MKTYSKIELEQLVSDLSDKVLENNVHEFISEATTAVANKSNVDAMLDMFVILYKTSQDNAKHLIVETLNKILNDDE